MSEPISQRQRDFFKEQFRRLRAKYPRSSQSHILRLIQEKWDREQQPSCSSSEHTPKIKHSTKRKAVLFKRSNYLSSLSDNLTPNPNIYESSQSQQLNLNQILIAAQSSKEAYAYSKVEDGQSPASELSEKCIVIIDPKEDANNNQEIQNPIQKMQCPNPVMQRFTTTRGRKPKQDKNSKAYREFAAIQIEILRNQMPDLNEAILNQEVRARWKQTQNDIQKQLLSFRFAIIDGCKPTAEEVYMKFWQANKLSRMKLKKQWLAEVQSVLDHWEKVSEKSVWVMDKLLSIRQLIVVTEDGNGDPLIVGKPKTVEAYKQGNLKTICHTSQADRSDESLDNQKSQLVKLSEE